MVEEGFDESQATQAIVGDGRLLEDYPEDRRCLILGKLAEEGRSRFVHIVCDYSDPECVDLVTAYVPQRPWWNTPTQRPRKKQ
jgi:hypothetical protein